MPDVSSTPFLLETNSFSSQIVLDDDNGTMNEALDGTDTNTNRAAAIDTNDKEGDGVDLMRSRKVMRKKAKDIFDFIGVQ